MSPYQVLLSDPLPPLPRRDRSQQINRRRQPWCRNHRRIIIPLLPFGSTPLPRNRGATPLTPRLDHRSRRLWHRRRQHRLWCAWVPKLKRLDWRRDNHCVVGKGRESSHDRGGGG